MFCGSLVLSRVQAFLPELAVSNADLLRRAKEDPDSVDIENVSDDQAQFIEMVSSFTPFYPLLFQMHAMHTTSASSKDDLRPRRRILVCVLAGNTLSLRPALQLRSQRLPVA